MTKLAFRLGGGIAIALGSFGCTTLPRASSPSTEEVDALADVELTEAEQAEVDEGAAVAQADAQRPSSTEVTWVHNGQNIQLAKNPAVAPVTASMIKLDKREALRLAKHAEGKLPQAERDAPPRGLSKADVAKD
jgi:hypothetical protein